MFGYIVRQLITKFFVIVVVSMFVFALFAFGPNNPAAVICQKSGRCTGEKIALLEESLGLNEPVTERYGTWVKGIFVDRTIDIGNAHYDCPAPCLGISYSSYRPVTEILVQRYPATLTLAIGGGIVYLLVGIPLGALAARWRGTATDKSLVSGSLVISSVPYFIVALLAWIYLYNAWHIFPETGYHPITDNPLKTVAGMLLPWLVMGVYGSTLYARYTRNEMANTLGEDFVRSATAKGVRRNKVVFKHALRAALVPVVTIFGLNFSLILSGTVFTEIIFDINGVGQTVIRSIQNLDYPIVSGMVLLTSILIVIGTLVVDLMYSVVDPRVRLV